MEAQTKVCQSCKKDFIIEPEDFNFYEKIKVPPPTFCPECRLIRRFLWRNEHNLFRRKNGIKESESLISIYHPNENIVSYDKETWWSDVWTPHEYGKDYDFLRSFFEQFKELMEKVPHLDLLDSKSTNSRFCHFVSEMKNSYLVTATWRSEDSMYSNRLWQCKFVLDTYTNYNVEFGYENVYCSDSNKLFFSRESEGCIDSYFLYDCRNCSNCILCTNLRNKSYCIENIQYTREEYLKKKKNLALDTRDGIDKAKTNFFELWKNAFHKHLKLTNTVNVIGDKVSNSRNCFYIFDYIQGETENVKYASWGGGYLKDSYDVGPGCGDKSELDYESVSVGIPTSRVLFSVACWYSSNVQYSYMLNNCHYCFGCVEMRDKKYCIFNKQYTKEEYDNLVPKIIEQMKEIPYVDRKGNIYKYGEFFPGEISPFTYNESIAQDYYPLTEKEAKNKGFIWREYVPGVYKKTIKGKGLPQTISEVDDSILRETIECEITGKPFKILEQELGFYRRFDLPLPSIHPDERHNKRLKLRNPMKITSINCYLCAKEIFTTYLLESEGGPKKVICTECYNKEIY